MVHLVVHVLFMGYSWSSCGSSCSIHVVLSFVGTSFCLEGIALRGVGVCFAVNLSLWVGGNLSRRDLHNYILRFYIHTPFWGLLLKYNVIRKL
jgi:hypothetical protein